MKFGLIFGHAASNFGDLAINTGALSLLRELDPECHVHVVFDAPQATYQEAAIASISPLQDVTYAFHPKRIPEKHNRGPLQRLQRYIADPGIFLTDNGLEDCDVLFYNSGEHLFSSREDENAQSLAWRTVAALAKEGSLVSVAGGGDTVAALNHAGVAEDFSYISTAGGAFLEWMEGRELPGVAALER